MIIGVVDFDYQLQRIYALFINIYILLPRSNDTSRSILVKYPCTDFILRTVEMVDFSDIARGNEI